MARYNEFFQLNPRDIALIEEALREQIARLVEETFTLVVTPQKGDREIHTLRELLGKLHNQKIWYSQVHHTGVPRG
jgi:hypothetical protein